MLWRRQSASGKTLTWKTGAIVAAHGVGAVREHITGPVFALVLVGHVARLAPKAVVAVTQAVETHAVDTLHRIGLAASVHAHAAPVALVAFEGRSHLVRAQITLRLAVAQARQLKQLQEVLRFVHLTSKVAVLEIEQEYLLLQQLARPLGPILRLDACRAPAYKRREGYERAHYAQRCGKARIAAMPLRSV